METKRFERLFIVVIVLLLVNIAVSFRPFQFVQYTAPNSLGVYRCNVYTGTVTLVSIGGELRLPP
jgi:hypothetical protein